VPPAASPCSLHIRANLLPTLATREVPQTHNEDYIEQKRHELLERLRKNSEVMLQ